MQRQTGGSISHQSPSWRPTPLSAALAVALVAGAAASAPVQAASHVGGAWFAAGGAREAARGARSGLPPGARAGDAAHRQQQQSRQQLSRSIANLERTATAIAAQQAAQEAARAKAGRLPSDIPDGLAEGGLVRADGSLAQWEGAKAPKESVKGGRHTVTIEQTASKAILAWESFSVGRKTTLDFQQKPTDAVLNKVVGAGIRPSEIQGTIKAGGTVMIVNRNGIVFSGTSQVNARNLVAAATRVDVEARREKGRPIYELDDKFRAGGIYHDAFKVADDLPATKEAGMVQVQAGARIATDADLDSTTGGGYVLLLGRQVSNAGTIDAYRGQALLAAGDRFAIDQGQGTAKNQASTTRGNLATATIGASSDAGTVVNTGLIQAATGDVTLLGRDVRQDGVALSTTSQDLRGTIHLTAVGAQGRVTLGQAGTTAILLSDTDATALDGQRDGVQAPAEDDSKQAIVSLATEPYRRDLSLVEIASGGAVDFAGGSLTLATGGQIGVQAATRALVRDGAVLDVSGALGVKVAMEANNVKINAQGNEQRDAPVNRESRNLNNSDVWVDRRSLVYVPADYDKDKNPKGYEADRWYTAGGLLEVSGYLATNGHGVGEWMAQGGMVRFGGGEVVTQRHSRINLSGGTLDVQSGSLRQSWLRGSDGRLYTVDRAPGDILYEGLYRGYAQSSERWGHTRYFYNALIAPISRREPGYTVGRDAGALVIGTKNAVLEGELIGRTYQGGRQTQAPQQGLDGYYQSQEAAARGARLIVGQYTPYYVRKSATRQYGVTATADTVREVILGAAQEKIAAGLDFDAALPAERERTLFLDTDQLNGAGLGGIAIAAAERISVEVPLATAPGGEITLYAPQVEVGADLASHGGTIRLGNVLSQIGSNARVEDTTLAAPAGVVARVAVAAGAALDASGLWSNLWRDPDDVAGLPYQDGGSVSIRSSGEVSLGKRSRVDVSSGAAILADGSQSGGRGGDVLLESGWGGGAQALRLDGELRGHGVRGAGTLTLRSAAPVVLGGQLLRREGWLQAGEAAPIALVLDEEVLVYAQGTPLPRDTVYDRVVAGQRLAQRIAFVPDTRVRVVVGAGGWDLTGTSLSVETDRGIFQGALRHTIPEDAVITRIIGGSLEANYSIPASVASLPTPSYVVAAGTPAPSDLVYAPGQAIAPGTVLDRRVAVRMPMRLDNPFFQNGFAQYDVASRQAVVVAPGAQLRIVRPAYRFGQAARDQATGGSPAAALEIWTPPLYQEDPVIRELTQRAGAGLTLRAGDASAPGSGVLLDVAEGARITVDPRQAISLASTGQLTVEGRLDAWGGRIELRQGTAGAGPAAADGSSAWIGERAVLDVAGRAATALDARGGRYGWVDAGGSIAIGSLVDPDDGSAEGMNLFAVIRPGALLDASGARAVLDLPGQGRVAVASAGGSIALASGNGLYLDGEMRARAGGAGAAGGSLQVSIGIGSPLLDTDVTTPARQRVIRELVVGRDRETALPAPGLTPEQAAQQLVYGHARLAARQVEAGGFDTLTLHSGGMIAFDGDVDLRMGQALNLYAGALGWAGRDAAAADGRVRLSAPYVRLAGSRFDTSTALDSPRYFRLGMHWSNTRNFGASQEPLAGRFTLRADRLLEVRGGQNVGTGGGHLPIPQLGGAGNVEYDRPGFDQVELVSGGDMRFDAGKVYASGDLLLAASQIYPVAGASAAVYAGVVGSINSVNFDPERVLTVARTTRELPAAPYSIAGDLTLAAGTVAQGGVVRAPLGTIGLGTSRSDTVRLLPGSWTSVSADGLLMPYGGTVDGVTWRYDGVQTRLQGVGAAKPGSGVNAGAVGGGSVALNGRFVDVRKGAVIDVSGGGELTGAGFVSGRGGSTDARYHPLVRTGPDGFTLPGLGDNPVYAIVPGVQAPVAPAGGEAGAVDPGVGQRITVGAGVPGLPAGTYTLLPSTYALLPGAFRVELDGSAAAGLAPRTVALRNGSWSAPGTLSVAGTAIRDSLARRVVLTPADVLRTYSQYDETSFADFVRADAARLGVPRAMTEADAKTLLLTFRDRDADSAGAVNFHFDGVLRDRAAKGGYGSTLGVFGTSPAARIEILGDAALPSPPVAPVPNPDGIAGYGVSLRASDLNRVGAGRLAIGGLPGIVYGQGGNMVGFGSSNTGVNTTPAASIRVGGGAQLRAPEVLLVTRGILTGDYAISIERGASINTLGQGAAPYGSGGGFIYQPNDGTSGGFSVVAVSNDRLQWLAPEKGSSLGPTPIRIGVCPSRQACAGTARLYSEGSIAFVTDNEFELDDAVRYGTRHLSLAVGAFNIGGAEALADAAARAAAAGSSLPPGLVLNETVMRNLLRGDASVGAPALETLELIAGQSVNFFGKVTLSTLDGRGKSLLDKLMLTAPAIYGYGKGGDVARIETGHLIWNGAAGAPGVVATGGAGTGEGTLEIDAERITFGYGPWGQPDGVGSLDRLTLGFADVDLKASERIGANNAGTLSVYQRQGAYVEGEGYRYSGGNLTVTTPLWTGDPGSVNRITAGGAIRVSAPKSGAADPAKVADLGAELSLTAGRGLSLDTVVALPSGKLTLAADGDLTLGKRSRLDLSGRAVTFFDDADATQYSWGGDVRLESTAGDVRQSAGSVIDLSAEYNQAGRLTAIALAEGAGAGAGDVDLQGRILGGASGDYEAGGTRVPYLSGGVEVRARTLGGGADLSEAFAALNSRLNDGEVFGLRAFQFKEGSLAIRNEPGTGAGDEPARASLKANQIEVSVDGGRLTVAGIVDASGERVGTIRLAGKRGLTIGGNALLDAHGTLLRIDSYGQIIDAPNRAVIELNSGDGVLALADGARMDLRYGTNDARAGSDAKVRARGALGTVELYAPRIDAGERANTADAATYGDVAIDARGGLAIRGAKSIAINAVQRYDDAPDGTDEAAGGKPYQVIDQAYLDAKHTDSTDFIDNALDNGDLLNAKLSGLNNATYRNVLHLRPGVEIVSRTPDGDLVVSGDLDLSGYRYDSLNPLVKARYVAGAVPRSAGYGSGEPGALAIRAGGDLNIYGSINDGFAPPPDTPDDNGWVLTPGVQAYGGDVVVPGAGVTLAAGTVFPAGKTLNYAVTLRAMTLPAGTRLPTQVELAAALTLPAGTVVGADVRDASDNVVIAAGTVLPAKVDLAAGARLGAGLRLPASTQVRAVAGAAGVRWPAGAALPVAAELAVDTPLSMGSLIPSMTDVKLPGDALSVPLRSATGGRMGRNWAVAAMLPEGSLSWGLRLAAGADLDAADPRLARPGAHGRVVLADTHYSLFEHRSIEGGLEWWFQDLAGGGNTGIGDGSWHAWDPGLLGGSYEDVGWLYCGFYIACEQRESEPVVGDTLAVHPVAQNFSVLRTGTGDLDLVAGGDVAMQSLYGVYTAGASTASRAGSQAASFDLARSRAADGTYLNTSKSAAVPAGQEKSGPGYEALVDGGEDSTYAAWYPDGGGNLLLRAGGDFAGDVLGYYYPTAAGQDLRPQRSSVDLGNWLWRQGSGNTAGVDPIAAGWWINFGTYVPGQAASNEASGLSGDVRTGAVAAVPELVGFTGVGTLGGGNLTVDVAGDAGMLARRGAPNVSDISSPQRSQALALAVAGTGRVLDDGRLLLTGGGDLDLRIGGSLNPSLAARATPISGRAATEAADYRFQDIDLNGAWTQLRGALRAGVGDAGGIALAYYRNNALQTDNREVRAYDPYTATTGAATGGPVLMLGDSAASLAARGDLVLAGGGDPGRVALPYAPPYRSAGAAQSGGYGWFSLWTDNTAIDLFSAGGNLTPSVQLGDVQQSGTAYGGRNHSPTDGRFVLPSQLGAVAASGSIYLGKSALGQAQYSDAAGSTKQYNAAYSLLLAPGADSRLEMLAGDSIYASGYSISRSGAGRDALPTPSAPAFVVFDMASATLLHHNLARDAVSADIGRFPLFAFGPASAAGNAAVGPAPARLYALAGDIVGLGSGAVLTFDNTGRNDVWYEGGGPVWMRAGRDIVRSGTLAGYSDASGFRQESLCLPFELVWPVNGTAGSGYATGNLFVHGAATDVSVVQAGRDILYSSFDVAGPGTLEIMAGRNILMTGQGGRSGNALTYGEAAFRSLGPAAPGDARPGADIVVQAGMGAHGADVPGFLAQYLDAANLALPDRPLADQPGKAAKTYEDELIAWLAERYGFDAGGQAGRARAYFAALPAEQQRIFARKVYFAELLAGGREYNDADGPRHGSYLRGRNAIAAFFPDRTPQGEAVSYGGDFIMYGDAGVQTLFGGDVQILTPGGGQIFGVEGTEPASTAGVVTQGRGSIQLYSRGSILLGQSRVMTTFGGSILAWSAAGDINAGRGAKTTIVYTPPRREYDEIGNVKISSNVPSTGAGIATLAPIAEVPPGDMDLIAPEGTIDAGEAGIRVSGNLNLAALHVVNAANIQVQGEAVGIPVVAAINVGALTGASAAASSAATAAADTVSRARTQARQNLPSIISVQILGFGDAAAPPARPEPGASRAPLPAVGGYDPASAVQVLGAGRLSEQEMRGLTPSERGRL